MYRILIVDDEQLNVAGIRAMIDPTVIELTILPSASNGEEAINTILSQSPDIVILDVTLPEYNGIEVVKEIQKSDVPCPLIIMMSCDNDFSQAREALRCGVFDFLVKSEITQVTLNRTLIRAVEYLDQFKSAENRAMPFIGHRLLIGMFYMRLLSSDEFPEEPEDVMRHLDIHFSYNYYCTIYVDSLTKMTMQREETEQMQRYVVSLLQKKLSAHYACQAMPWNSDGYAAILASNDPIAIPDGLLTQCLNEILEDIKTKYGVQLTAGIGSDVNDTKRVRMSFVEAQNTYSSTNERQKVLLFQQVGKNNAFNTEKIVDRFRHALENEDIEVLDDAVSYMKECLNTKTYHMRSLIFVCSDIMHMALVRIDGLRKAILDEYKTIPCPTVTVSMLKTTNDVVNWLDMLKRNVEMCVNNSGKGKKNIVVEAMKDYIMQHCEETISLQSIAETFNFSTSYISRLFRQCNDIGFSEFITTTRMERAKELLLEEHNTVVSIASMLGYDDPYYFSRVFKKHVGISPREYVLQKHIQSGKDTIAQ